MYITGILKFSSFEYVEYISFLNGKDSYFYLLQRLEIFCQLCKNKLPMMNLNFDLRGIHSTRKTMAEQAAIVEDLGLRRIWLISCSSI